MYRTMVLAVGCCVALGCIGCSIHSPDSTEQCTFTDATFQYALTYDARFVAVVVSDGMKSCTVVLHSNQAIKQSLDEGLKYLGSQKRRVIALERLPAAKQDFYQRSLHLSLIRALSLRKTAIDTAPNSAATALEKYSRSVNALEEWARILANYNEAIYDVSLFRGLTIDACEHAWWFGARYVIIVNNADNSFNLIGFRANRLLGLDATPPPDVGQVNDWAREAGLSVPGF